MDCIDRPTLVIHGPADGIVPLDVARSTASRISDSVFCQLERTGHIAMIERPATYNDLLQVVSTTGKAEQPLVESVTDVFNGTTSQPE